MEVITFTDAESRVLREADREDFVILPPVGLTQHRRLTDGQTALP